MFILLTLSRFQEGMKYNMTQELASLRAQQATLSNTMERLMDENECEDDDDEEEGESKLEKFKRIW